MKQRVTISFISCILLFVFGYTAISKLLHYSQFRAALRRTPFLSFGAATLALAIPLAELVIVLLLLFSPTKLKGLYAAAGLLSVFTIYLFLMLLFAPYLPCSCGGVIEELSWPGHLGLNAGLLGIAALGIRTMQKRNFS